MNERIREVFSNFYTTVLDLLPNLLVAIFFFLLFALLGYLIGKGFAKGVRGKWKGTIVVSYLGKVFRWLFNLIGLIVAFYILGFGAVANTLLTSAGVSAIIIGFAFKDIAENFLAGLLMLISRPFEIGHIIEVNGHRGAVKEVNLRTTHIRNITGKDIYLPNSVIVKNVVINYTRDGYLRLDFSLGLDIPTDIQALRPLIIEFLKKQPEVLSAPEPDVLIRDVSEFTIDIQVLFWVDVLKQKSVPPAYLGETIRSRILAEVKDLILSRGYNMPSQIIEHKMYHRNEPLMVGLQNENQGGGNE
ncbi:MAG: mechanosensitive ion channel family protein [Saprospiraceae bacterium]|nr:mechanosensitive ion channel family protein [Lewinella sp.]